MCSGNSPGVGSLSPDSTSPPAKVKKAKITNDYEILLKQFYDRELAERNWHKNDQFVEELTQNDTVQPKKRRFHLRLPEWSRFQLRQIMQPCADKRIKNLPLMR